MDRHLARAIAHTDVLRSRCPELADVLDELSATYHDDCHVIVTSTITRGGGHKVDVRIIDEVRGTDLCDVGYLATSAFRSSSIDEVAIRTARRLLDRLTHVSSDTESAHAAR